MKNLKGTKTERNLMDAFAGESQARNRYTYFADKAKKEGYGDIAAFFEETARNEMEHAKVWFVLLSGGDIPETATNLLAAAAGEHEEWTVMYKRMEAEAREEGLDSVAFFFEKVANIEKKHEERYLRLLKKLEGGDDEDAVTEKKVWICRECGHIEVGENPPEKCPVCGHLKDHFELRIINY